jgi:hypothetical protein
MKNSILIALVCFGILPVSAQKVVEKHIPFSGNKLVSMNFQISDSIRIITWNKSEVFIKSSINVNDNKNNDDYKMSFDEGGSDISIRGKLEMNGSSGCCGNSHNNCCCCCTSEIYHDVYLPENADFSVETINGNIIITGKTAGIRAHTISGYIDLAISPERKADIRLNTITGTMYSNIDLQASSSSGRKIRQVGGGSIDAQLNGGGGKPIDLETISGNIFFRKEG